MTDRTTYNKVLQICREVNPDIPDNMDELLIDCGYVDSFGAFMILTSIELEFDVEISSDDIKHDNFKNIRSLIDLIKRCQQHKG